MPRPAPLRLMAAAALLCTPAAPAAPEVYSILTGGVSGVYFPVGGALCRTANRAGGADAPRCTALASDGSRANLEALRAGEAAFAIVQSDLLARAVAGETPFATVGPNTDLRAVLALHVEAVTVAVPAESDAMGLGDLQGLRVNLGAQGSGARATAEQLLAALGWRAEDIAATGAEAGEAPAEALCAGDLDAAVYVVGHPALQVQLAANLCDIRLLPVEDLALSDLAASGQPFRTAEIPGGLYRGIDAPVPSLGTVASLVTTATTSEAIVNALTEAVLAAPTEFTAMHPALSGLDARALTPEGLPAPAYGTDPP